MASPPRSSSKSAASFPSRDCELFSSDAANLGAQFLGTSAAAAGISCSPLSPATPTTVPPLLFPPPLRCWPPRLCAAIYQKEQAFFTWVQRKLNEKTLWKEEERKRERENLERHREMWGWRERERERDETGMRRKKKN